MKRHLIDDSNRGDSDIFAILAKARPVGDRFDENIGPQQNPERQALAAGEFSTRARRLRSVGSQVASTPSIGATV